MSGQWRNVAHFSLAEWQMERLCLEQIFLFRLNSDVSFVAKYVSTMYR